MLGMTSAEPIDTWLEAPPILRHVAYAQLYLSNDELTAYLLGVEVGTLDRWERAIAAGEAPSGWSAEDAFVLLRRVRNGLLTEQILRFERVEEAQASLEAKFSSWVGRYPFPQTAATLRSAFHRVGLSDLLGEMGLWRRLVFQYHAAHELPYQQILERTSPAADVVGARLTNAMLTGWIGMGRLWTQLAKAEEVVAV